jgi:hypothetical protein
MIKQYHVVATWAVTLRSFNPSRDREWSGSTRNASCASHAAMTTHQEDERSKRGSSASIRQATQGQSKASATW